MVGLGGSSGRLGPVSSSIISISAVNDPTQIWGACIEVGWDVVTFDKLGYNGLIDGYGRGSGSGPCSSAVLNGLWALNGELWEVGCLGQFFRGCRYNRGLMKP